MTAERGTLFDEGPTACPFVALDRDRERRADEPDSRHRCYATPVPEPRALAHQRNFCLTPTFSACPIFQDWAVRAAARPVPLRPIPSMPPPMSEEEMAASLDAAAAAGMDQADERRAEQVSLFGESVTAPGAPARPPPVERDAGLADPATRGDRATPGERAWRGERAPATAPSPAEPSRSGQSAAAFVPTPNQPVIPPPARPQRYAPAPGPKPQPQATPVKGKPTLRKEDIVPSWERARYDLPSGEGRRSRGGDLFSRFTLLFSAFAILALAVLVILLVPILLSSRPGTATPRPTQLANSSPTAVPSPTAAPTPQSTWVTYTIKLGDNLYKIATSFNITYEQLLAANPAITNPNYIVAGQVINIPPPEFAPPSPSIAPSAARSPSPSP